MVLFHLACVEDAYPYAKAVVYTFHMPVFLFLSGFFANMVKPAAAFGRYILWIFIPYAVMESAYTGMSAVLPVRDPVESLSPVLILHNVFLRPIGPYWYLHSYCGSADVLSVQCGVSTFADSAVSNRIFAVSRLVVIRRAAVDR